MCNIVYTWQLITLFFQEKQERLEKLRQQINEETEHEEKQMRMEKDAEIK